MRLHHSFDKNLFFQKELFLLTFVACVHSGIKWGLGGGFPNLALALILMVLVIFFFNVDQSYLVVSPWGKFQTRGFPFLLTSFFLKFTPICRLQFYHWQAF